MSSRKIIGVVVVGVWLVAIGLLLHRELGGRTVASGSFGAPDEVSSTAFAVEVAGGRRVGHIWLDRVPETRGGAQGSVSKVRAGIVLELLGKPTDLDLRGEVWRPFDAEAAGKRAEIDFGVTSKDHTFRLEADLLPGLLQGTVTSAGESLPIEFPVQDDLLVENGLGASLRFPAMDVGETVRFASFDPLTLSPGQAKVRCVGEETLQIGEHEVTAKVLEVESGGIETKAWIDADGEVLRAETPLGLTLVRLPSALVSLDLAAAGLDPGADAEDLEQATRDWLAQSAVRPAGTKPRRGAERLLLRIVGADLGVPEDDAQRSPRRTEVEVVRLGPAETVAEPQAESESALEPYLRADAFVQSDHPKIREQAAEIVGDETDPWRKATRLHDWVFERLEKEPVVSIPSALEVLRSGRGDCNEHTVLYTALARAAELPTRIAIGLVWSDELDGFYYHAWPEVWVETHWVRVDPTLGQPVADATHVKLLEGGIETWPRLLAYLGKIRIEVLEMEPLMEERVEEDRT